MASCSTCPLPRSCYGSLGAPSWCIRVLFQSWGGGEKVWAEAEMADHPQFPLRRLLLLLPKMAAHPQMLFSHSSNPSFPHQA